MTKRILVVVEVAAVFLAGTFSAMFLLRRLGLAGAKQAIRAANAAEFDAAAVAVPLVLRWSIVIGLAFLAGWLLARHRPRDYGITLAGSPLSHHLGLAAITYVYMQAPVSVLSLLRHYLDLPGGPAFWKVIEGARWDADFWLFMLASSIALPPLFEEMFFRGYAQVRLATVFRPMTATVLISAVFILVHTQYLDGTFVGTSRIVAGFWWTLLLGIARLRSGSLIAPIVAHALSNTPLRPEIEAVLLVVLVIAAVRTWPRFRPFLLAPLRVGPAGRNGPPAA